MQKTKHNSKPTKGTKTTDKNKPNNSKISRKKPTGKAPNKTKQRPPNNGGNSLVASLKNGLKMAMSIGLPVLLIVVGVVQLSLYGYLPSHFYYSSQYIYSSAVGWLICSFIIGFIVKPKENKEETKKVGKKVKSNVRMEEEEEIEGEETIVGEYIGDEYFEDEYGDEEEEEAPRKKSLFSFGSKEKKPNKKAKKKVKSKKVIEEEIEEDEEVLEDDMYAEELVMEQPKSRIAKPVPTLTSTSDDMGDLLDLYSSQSEPSNKVDLHAAGDKTPAPEMVKLEPVVAKEPEVINEEPEPVIPEPPKVEEVKEEEPRVITPPPAQHINLKSSSSKAVFQERIVETKPAEVPEVKEEQPQPVEEVPATVPTVVEQARQEYPEVPYVRPAIPTIATPSKVLTRQEFAVDMVNKAYNELTAVEKFVLDYDILEEGQAHLLLNEGSNLLRCTSIIVNGRLYSASECHSINIPDKAQVVCFYGVRINKLNRKGNLKPMHKLEAIAAEVQVPTLEFLVRTGSVLHVVAYFDEPRIIHFRDLTCTLNFSTEGERY